MAPLRARVHDGRLVLDEPTDLPEGSEVDLVRVADDWDDLDDEDRARLHDALDASVEAITQGRVMPAEDLIAELRRRAR